MSKIRNVLLNSTSVGKT